MCSLRAVVHADLVSLHSGVSEGVVSDFSSVDVGDMERVVHLLLVPVLLLCSSDDGGWRSASSGSPVPALLQRSGILPGLQLTFYGSVGD